jgi:hypothetical protein
MADTHKVTKTKVMQLENGAYGVEFEFDDGYTDFAEVGSTPRYRWAKIS